jgi:hypothetical protein
MFVRVFILSERTLAIKAKHLASARANPCDLVLVDLELCNG